MGESEDYEATSNNGREYLSLSFGDSGFAVFTAIVNQPAHESGDMVVVDRPEQADIYELRVFVGGPALGRKGQSAPSQHETACHLLLEQLRGLTECTQGILARIRGTGF